MGKTLFIPSENLKDSISRLERMELEGKSFPYISIEPYLGNSNFIQILGITKYEEDKANKGIEFRQRMKDIIIGLYGENIPFLYFILGRQNRIEVYFGIFGNFQTQEFLKRIFKGVFPKIEMKIIKESKALIKDLHLTHGVLVTGVPTLKLSGEEEAGQIDWVIRGLMGEEWAYMITALPIDQSSITSTYEVISNEIRNTKNKFLRSHTIEEQNNPFAQYYINLLEVSLEKYRLGRSIGMWVERGFLFTGSIGAMIKGKSVLRSTFSGENSIPHPLRLHDLYHNERRETIDFPFTALNSEDLSIFTQLPKNEFQGFSIKSGARFEISFSSPNEDSLQLGIISDGDESTGKNFEIDPRELSKHVLIAGVTGSGKTNTTFSLLCQLWENHRVPFLVIEPSIKREYRVLYQKIDKLLVFTIGDETMSPFRFNIFKPQGEISLQTHIDYLRSLFLASFALYPPMPYVLDHALHQIYLNKGWNLSEGVNVRGQGDLAYPTLTDLYEEIERVVDKLGYENDISQNVKAGLKTRINNLRIGGKGMMLDVQKGLSIEELVGQPTILELASVGDDEEKAFIIGAILIGLCEYFQSYKKNHSGLSHVTVIEEAHRLLRNTSQEFSDFEMANIRGKALETFCNLLSEVRAFGGGIIIVEQIPSKLAPDVVKNTSIKIVHRIVAKDDRDLVGDTMNLSEGQKIKLSTLLPGEAIAYGEGLDGAFLINIPKFNTTGLLPEFNDIKYYMQDRFYKRRSDYLLPKQGCYGCQDVTRCESIKGKVKVWLEDNFVQESFSRFFLSLLEGVKVAKSGCQEMIERISQINGHKFSIEMIPYIYCLGMNLIEKKLIERGYIFSWKYNVIQELCLKFAKILECLWDENASIEDKIQEFKKDYIMICSNDLGPGVYCKFCEVSCLYFLEVKEIFKCGPIFKAIEEGIRRVEGMALWKFLAEMCKRVAEILSISKDPKILKNLSLCAANLIGVIRGYPTYEQRRVFENTKILLEENR